MKKTKVMINYLIYLMLATSIACNNDADSLDPKIYESCCGTEPFEWGSKATGNYIFIPNAFTPNGDAVNDNFFPVFNEQVVSTLYMVIERDYVDDNTPTLLYQTEVMDNNTKEELGWNGKDTNNKPYKGSFKYTIFFNTKDVGSFLVTGRACAIECGPEAALLKNNTNCFFFNQADNAGVLNKTAANNEGNCFR